MAQHRHKREPDARSFPGRVTAGMSHLLSRPARPARADRSARRTGPGAGWRPAALAAPLAVAATVGVVSLGVSGADSTLDVAAPTLREAVPSPAADPGQALSRVPSLSRGTVSRDTDRAIDKTGVEAKAEPRLSHAQRLMTPAAVRKAIAGADTKRWTTESLNLWTGPSVSARQTGVLDPGERVLLTGRELADRVEIVWGKSQTRWVTAGYLTDEEPGQEPEALGAACTNGTTVPDAVSANVKKVHEAVCAAFPDITTYGTFRDDGEHSQGLAVDIMVTGARGDEIAEFVRDNAAELGVNYVIWSQQIWSVERSGEGWRGMEDRGSATANHFDHVHVTVF